MSGAESSLKLPGKTTVTCPGCSAAISNYTFAQAMYFCCATCHRYYRRENNTLTLVGTLKVPVPVTPIAPLGTKVILKNINYHLTGFIQRKQLGEDYFWREYVLFNPVQGYVIISEYDGHWTFLEQVSVYPKISFTDYEFDLEERTFKLFLKYGSHMEYLAGEFCWNPFDDDKAKIYEYISPPYSYSAELTEKEIAWYRAEYMQPAEVTAAFQTSTSLPERIGVGALQTQRFRFPTDALKKVTFVVMGLIFLLQLIFAVGAPEKVVYTQSYYGDSLFTQKKPLVSQAIVLENGTSNLQFQFSSPVNNNWAGLELTLINAKTGEHIYLYNEIGYYSGSDSDGSWSEGSQSDAKTVSRVPEGVYYLSIHPTSDASAALTNFTITLIRNVVSWSNFFLFEILLGLIPLILIFLQKRFEQKRWMLSDYSPYNFGSNDN